MDMNYYPHHIGDFNNDTRHLTRIERSIYRDLIELYYDSESPLTVDHEALCRKVIARSDEEMAAVKQVLGEFFTLEDGGWVHSRCEQVIAEYRSKAEVAKANGKLGGRPKRAGTNPEKPSRLIQVSNKKPSDNPEETGSKANQEPRTNNQKKSPQPPKGGKKPAVGIEAFLDDCKTKSVKAIPESDPVFDWADEAGVPMEFLRLAWREFVDRYRDGTKRYADWRAVFRKAVRGNWLKLWYIDASGQYNLTTVGHQASRVHREAA